MQHVSNVAERLFETAVQLQVGSMQVERFKAIDWRLTA